MHDMPEDKPKGNEKITSGRKRISKKAISKYTKRLYGITTSTKVLVIIFTCNNTPFNSLRGGIFDNYSNCRNCKQNFFRTDRTPIWNNQYHRF